MLRHYRSSTRWFLLVAGLFAALMVSLSPALAQSEGSGDDSSDEAEASVPGRNLMLWMGLDAGGSFSSSDDEDKETSKTGFNFGGKVYLTKYSSKIAFDLGLGWTLNRLRAQDDVVPATPEQIANGERDKESVETRYGVAELGMRWFLTESFELGPAAQVSFGTDSSFSPYEEEDTSPQVFLGGQALWNLGDVSDASSLRVGAQVLTDASISGRQISFVNLNFYFGIPLARQPQVVKVYKSKEKVVRQRYIIDAGLINFPTGKSELTARQQAYLKELGELLVAENVNWGAMLLTSHTDSRGGAEINEPLSRARADSVQSVLVENGVDSEKIRVKSKASASPVSNESDDVQLAQNRRVELEVIGGFKAIGLKRKILRLKQAHRLPSTCTGEDCN